jgi:hypothetical protein
MNVERLEDHQATVVSDCRLDLLAASSHPKPRVSIERLETPNLGDFFDHAFER